MRLLFASLQILPQRRAAVSSLAFVRRIRMTSQRQQDRKYAKLPKVELHVHMDGTCRLSTLQELSKKYDLDFPHDHLEEFKEVVCVPRPQPSLSDFLQPFLAVGKILRTREDIVRVSYEFCEDLARQSVVYAELRFSPFLGGDLPADQYVDGVLSGLEQGQKDFGIKMRVILAFMREQPECCMGTVRLAEQFHHRGVVGVDIAGDELLPLDPRHVEGFKEAKRLGLHVTVHAAESGPASNVKAAIEQLGAERIGHGYNVLNDPSVYQLAKERGIHFELWRKSAFSPQLRDEVCPTSSVYTSSAAADTHAVRRFAADGVSFSLNSDDPGIMLIDLTNEYEVAERDMGLTQEQIIQSVFHAARATFLPPDEKKELLKTVEEKVALFRREA